jgi:glycerophosphoryl diester phosphodiesterase
MDDKTLATVAREFARRRPEEVKILRALTAARGTELAQPAEMIVLLCLQLFDEREQLQWQLRDLLKRVEKYDANSQPDYYWALKYNATEMVRRIHAAGDFPDCKVEWPLQDYAHE